MICMAVAQATKTIYPSLKGLIDAQFALVLYYNAAIPIKVSVTDNS